MNHKLVLTLAMAVFCFIRISGKDDIRIEIREEGHNERVIIYYSKKGEIQLRPDEVSFKDATGKRIRIINMPIVIETD